MGRPSIFTQELAAAICERLAAGESLLSICAAEDMPARSTVCLWVTNNTEEFSDSYARARDVGLDVMAEEAIKIADTTQEGVKEVDKENRLGDPVTEVTRADMIEHRRLRVDTRKWYLSKLAPKRYGDRSSVELTGADGGPIEIDDHTRAAKIEAIYAAAARLRGNDGSDLV